jgi:sugar-specific transcriptional regulator TrmB
LGSRLSRTDSIVGFLKDLGLNEREIKIYLVILKTGSVSAGELASYLQLSRLEVYRALEKLIDKDLIEGAEGRPKRYSAAKIESVLNGRIQESKEGTAKMERERASLIEEASQFDRGKPQSLSTNFRLIHGRKNIFRFAGKLYDSAQTEICSMDTGIELIRCIDFGLDDVQESCAKRGVTVRKITDINERNLEAAERFLEFCELRHSSLHSIARIYIVDEEEVMFYPASGDDTSWGGEHEICLWTTNREFARLIKRSFEAAWEAASDGRIRIREIERQARAVQSGAASEFQGTKGGTGGRSPSSARGLGSG